MSKFNLKSPFKPTGDQPQAIQHLTHGINAGMKHQVLLGVTGSGKTFTMANVIANTQKPALVISHNKTLAAQLFQEYKEFFPENAVEYFVSYYDYYQPEAYLPQTDTYIEKDADINEDIDKLRLATTTSLLTRRDVIVVASVSCIYNLGSPKEYQETTLRLKVNMPLRHHDLLIRLTQLFYLRSDYEFKRGTFRVGGDTVDVFPAYLDFALRLELLNDKLASIRFINPITGKPIKHPSGASGIQHPMLNKETSDVYNKGFVLYPAKHYITNKNQRQNSIKQIKNDLHQRVQELKAKGKELEAYRLEQKTNYDLELIQEIGYCKGIENYSRYFDGRTPGEPPYTLLDFFPDDYLTIIDESHITAPQIRGMYNGDQSRKQTLIDYGFRLPSALDNRPLRFEEFLGKTNQVIYTSATPDAWEQREALTAARGIKHPTRLPARQVLKKKTSDVTVDYPKKGIVEQLIRPTGLLDPEIQIRGTQNQIENLIQEIIDRVKVGERVLVTTLTKRMAEDLSDYLKEQDIKVQYLHADIDTLDRVDILDNLRRGKYDVVVGINLLREGLDLPEVSLVAILDADKEGFLRSETSLIQTMGRASRHKNGKVIMYADTITGSMQRAIDEVKRRRKIQEKYNQKYNITPQTIQKPFREKLIDRKAKPEKINYAKMPLLIQDKDIPKMDRREVIQKLEKAMRLAAKNLEFEQAAIIRDRIDEMRKLNAVKY